MWHSHAEQNIIAFAAREGIKTRGCALFVTHMPCSSCARSIIQAGICEVWYDNGTTTMPSEDFEIARQMFVEACIDLIDINSPEDIYDEED
jgi:dCMP deaminase